jgi:hypothetical protein
MPARRNRAGSERRRKLTRTAQPCRSRKIHPRRPAPAVQTASRARPFARRARSTARPPRVRIRTRKPCVRLRRVTDGWYVRFICSLRPWKSAVLQPLTYHGVNLAAGAPKTPAVTFEAVDNPSQNG